MYKFSQFNSIVPFGNEFAFYNAFNQKLILIRPELREIVEAANRESPEELKHFHPEFFKYLIEEEFLVATEVDEVQKVKDLQQAVDQNDEMFQLFINPTMNCNFKCWYCYETHIKGSKMDEVNVRKVNKLINTIASNPQLKYFVLSFFGGEPLLYFKKSVIPIVDEWLRVCEKNQIDKLVGFTTNGYLINDGFIQYFNDHGIKCELQITLDGHKEQHDKVRMVNAKKGSYDRIVSNIKTLVENEFPVNLRINYTEENIANCYSIAEDVLQIDKASRDRHLTIDLQKVWQSHPGPNIAQHLNKVAKEFRENGLNARHGSMSMNNVKQSCYADRRNSATVNYNGELFKCTARDFTTTNSEGKLDEEGNMIWNTEKKNLRDNIKFKNPPCLSCRILPLCNGGCSQVAIENVGKDYCVHEFDESRKDQVILEKVNEIIQFQQLKNRELSDAVPT